MDDCVLRACVQSGLRCSQLALPKTMYLWIDPQEVSCRLGESCRPFIVKAPEDKKVSKMETMDKSDQETSDYHSDGSDRVGTPSESSSEDEESGKNKSAQSTHLDPSKKIGAQYFYSPSPASTLLYRYPTSTVGFLPAFQPMALYYLLPKPPKFYSNSKSRGTHQKRKSTRTSPQSKC
ncbi:hypothetical protein GDO86_012218 [Hymenochirus boettgeri]|nr:hypothetical protein GDO86_012218 [Hymenochirus boettgeri]